MMNAGSCTHHYRITLLDGMMKGLSHAAGTARVYTNHCLRATSVVHMKQNDAEDRKIGAYAGHGFHDQEPSRGLTVSASTTGGCIKDAVQVAAIQHYVSKLHPDLDRLFQRARAPAGMLASENDECWFMHSPLSHNLLDGMMKGLSHAAGTARVYTNHCLRATSGVHMKQNDAEDRKIGAYAGHGFHDQEPSRGTDSVCIDDWRLHQGRCASGCYPALREQASP